MSWEDNSLQSAGIVETNVGGNIYRSTLHWKVSILFGNMHAAFTEAYVKLAWIAQRKRHVHNEL